jgi:hypothetical protein
MKLLPTPSAVFNRDYKVSLVEDGNRTCLAESTNLDVLLATNTYTFERNTACKGLLNNLYNSEDSTGQFSYLMDDRGLSSH